MVPADAPHFPVIPHRKAGANCNGSIVPEQDGENVTLKCNQCGVVVGTINAAILAALEQAIADAFVFHKFTEMDAPEVLTAISEECHRGECDHCPGHFQREDTGEATIFCIHECHEVEREPGPIN